MGSWLTGGLLKHRGPGEALLHGGAAYPSHSLC